MNLHSKYMTSGKTHAGIILGDQQCYSVGEQMRRLLRIITLRSAEAMVNSYEFLNAW